ncbi:MAG: universal stress protein [Desulfobacterales bacterium]|jgi:nucleotide-binding universal stress UspA family protein
MLYNKIMVPLDGSELAECVMPHVEAITTGCKSTNVVFARVVNPVQLPASVPARGKFSFTETERQQLYQQHKQAAEAYLKRMVASTRLEGAVLSYEVLEGKVADALAHWAEKNEVDLIVIASHGRSGVSRWVMGSVAERVLRSACVPVLMVRAPGCFPGI